MTPRLLAATAGAALTFALAATPLPAAADVTVPTVLPTGLASPSVPVDVPTVSVPLPSAELPPLPAVAPPPAGEPASAAQAQLGSGPAAAGLPTATELPELPELPALPGSGGGESPPPAPAAGGDGSTSGSSPLGDDVLPAELEAELCTLLTTVLGPLPAQVRGLPSTVIAELPAEVTDLVPADVLATVTLRCPAAEAAPPSQAPAEVRSVSTRRVAQAAKGSSTAVRRPVRSGLVSLPHTGLVAGVALAGAALLLTGLAVRRAGRARGEDR
jgi:hypothetical protein